MSDEKMNYSINLDNKFGSLQLVDVPAIVAEVKDEWFNQTLTQVNDCVVRLGVMQGEFHWHHHENEDEFFFVLSGKFIIDLEDKTIELGPQQGFTVPRTVRHRTRAPERSVILMFEGSGVKPTGD
jgi:mannose-6-phosphate isomerase-like protein (cupin superfamily)